MLNVKYFNKRIEFRIKEHPQFNLIFWRTFVLTDAERKIFPFSLSRTAFSSSRAEKRFESGSSFILCLYPHFSQFSWVVWGGGSSAISQTVPTVALDAWAYSGWDGWKHHQTSLSVVHFTFSVSNEHRSSQDVICRLQLQSAVEGTQTVPSLHSSQFFSHTFLWW